MKLNVLFKGESIEEAIRREIHEECGLFTNEIIFHSTQPWPFPSNVMIGCLAYASTDDIKVNIIKNHI